MIDRGAKRRSWSPKSLLLISLLNIVVVYIVLIGIWMIVLHRHGRDAMLAAPIVGTIVALLLMSFITYRVRVHRHV